MGKQADRDLSGLANRALDAFAESASRRRDRDALMDTAFAALLDLYRATSLAQRRSPAGREFRATLAELLVSGSNPYRLGLYVVRGRTAALDAERETYRSACWRRSVLELLGTEFVPWEEFLGPEDVAALARVEEALVEAAARVPADGGEEVPSWVPESHWWWWEPVRQRGGNAPERRDGGTLDPVGEAGPTSTG